MHFALGIVQQRFRLGAMSSHVVMVRGARPLHFMDCLDYMVVDLVELVPIVDAVGDGGSAPAPRPLHFMDGLDYMVVDLVELVPIVDAVGDGGASHDWHELDKVHD